MPAQTTAVNDAAGNVNFGKITFTTDLLQDAITTDNGVRTKEFEYKVTESGSAAGVTNDANASTGKTFKLTLTDDGNGNLTVTRNPADGPLFSFTNTYRVGELPSSITDQVKVNKTLEGRTLKEGEFNFELVEDGNVVATGSNDADGNVVFSSITYTQPGSHVYTVREVKGSETGVTYDDHSYLVYTQITDNGDGTATFTMKELNDGDTVSIGGKNYTIGSKEADAKALIEAPANGDPDKTFTIGDKTFKVKANGDVCDKDGNKLYVKTAGGATAAEAFDTSKELTTDSTFKNNANTDTANTAVTVANLKDYVKGGVKVSDGTTTMTVLTDAKDASGAAGADGVDDNDTSVITKQKAYELAGKELLAANQIGDTEGHASVTNGDGTGLAFNAGNGTFKINVGQAKVANTLSFSLHVGADADMTNKITVDIDTMNSANLGIKGLNVTDKNGSAATYAIDAISDAISKVSSQRSALGAVQNRLEHTIDNLDNISENTSSAESRIRDTDMAKEMVNYSKNNILAQAGQSMLAQANQSNQGVLSLLQ